MIKFKLNESSSKGLTKNYNYFNYFSLFLYLFHHAFCDLSMVSKKKKQFITFINSVLGLKKKLRSLDKIIKTYM